MTRIIFRTFQIGCTCTPEKERERESGREETKKNTQRNIEQKPSASKRMTVSDAVVHCEKPNQMKTAPKHNNTPKTTKKNKQTNTHTHIHTRENNKNKKQKITTVPKINAI